MGQTQQQQQQQQEFVQGKLEIKDDDCYTTPLNEDYRTTPLVRRFGQITHILYPETIIILNALLCEWVRLNYSEMIQFFHKHDYTEYEDSLNLCDRFWQEIDINSPLIEFITNSGIIENHRVSIYLYCCQEMSINIDHADQYEDDRLDIRDDRKMSYYLFRYYDSDDSAGEIIINEFIEIRDSQGLK